MRMPRDAWLADKIDKRSVRDAKHDEGPYLIAKEKCTRKDPNQAKCDRCSQLSYTCTIDDVNASLDGKRRKLHKLKCEACRSSKVKVD
jgi:hypothetical protein